MPIADHRLNCTKVQAELISRCEFTGMCVHSELLTVSGRRLLLRDQDSSSVTIGKSERRLNTLSHYRVPDGSTLAVVTHYNTTGRSSGQYINRFEIPNNPPWLSTENNDKSLSSEE